MPQLPPLRTKWSDYDRAEQPSFPIKVREELIRDQILDWLAFSREAMAWWCEPFGALKKRGGKLRFMAPTNRHYRTGIPDILGSWRGRPLGIEVKRPMAVEIINGKKVKTPPGVASDAQVAFMHEARSKGWVCFFSWTLADAKQSLIEFDQSMGVTNVS